MLLLALAGTLSLTGCAARSQARAGSLRLAAPVPGTAAPATASRLVDRSSVTLPAGSTLTLPTAVDTAPGGTSDVRPSPPCSSNAIAPAEMTYTLSAPAVLVREISRDQIATATGHDPPSPAEIARGEAVTWFVVAALVCWLIAGLLAWRQHWLAALCAAGAGLALPVLAWAFSSAWAIPVAVGLLTAAGAFFVAWHIIERQRRAPSSHAAV